MKTAALALALGALAVAAQSAPNDMVIYKQMPHQAVGTATLAVSPGGDLLRVRQLGDAGKDGFRTRLPQNSKSWRAEFLADLEAGDTLRFNPVSQGDDIAPLNIVGRDQGFSASVEFTSSPDPAYRVLVVSDGMLVSPWICYLGGFCEPDDGDPPGGGGGGGGPGGIIIDVEPIPGGDIEDPTLFEDDFDQTPSGNCRHAMRIDGQSSVSVAGLHLGNGDQVVIEEVASTETPRYPYAGFEAVRVQSSAAQLVIIDEAAN
ncbi:MAG: hypothetical protein AAGA68_21845 [Pseudomonadota bacterium]